MGRSRSEPTRELACTETKAPVDRHDPEGAQATTRNSVSRSPMCTPPIRRMASVHKGSPREAIPRTATPSSLADGVAPALIVLHTPAAPGTCLSHRGRTMRDLSSGRCILHRAGCPLWVTSVTTPQGGPAGVCRQPALEEANASKSVVTA